MVLAAGMATRLRPLTDAIAKAVVPFLNRPLLDYTLEWLASEGLTRVVINLHHAPESIRGSYGSAAFGLQIDYSPEEILLGTAGGPRAALSRLGPRILLVNGDVLTRGALQPLLRRHRDSGALATLALYDGEQAIGYPRVTADRAGRLRAFPGDTPPLAAEDRVAGVFTGIHLVEREVIAPLPVGEPMGIVVPVYRDLLAAGAYLGAMPLQGCWYEAGDPSRYLHAQITALRRGDLPLALAGSRQHEPAGFVATGDVPPPGTLLPPYLLGAGARIAPEARGAGLVLGAGARIEKGCEVTDAVLWEDAVVERGCRLREVIVMDGVRVAPGTHARRTVFSRSGAAPFDSGGGPAS